MARTLLAGTVLGWRNFLNQVKVFGVQLCWDSRNVFWCVGRCWLGVGVFGVNCLFVCFVLCCFLYQNRIFFECLSLMRQGYWWGVTLETAWQQWPSRGHSLCTPGCLAGCETAGYPRTWCDFPFAPCTHPLPPQDGDAGMHLHNPCPLRDLLLLLLSKACKFASFINSLKILYYRRMLGSGKKPFS